jgi:hypothetical protein
MPGGPLPVAYTHADTPRPPARTSPCCHAHAARPPGPREELSALPLFLELPLLLPPGAHVELHMVGPDVPPRFHGTCREWSGLPGPPHVPSGVCSSQGRAQSAPHLCPSAVPFSVSCSGCDGPACCLTPPLRTNENNLVPVARRAGGGSLAITLWHGSYHQVQDAWEAAAATAAAAAAGAEADAPGPAGGGLGRAAASAAARRRRPHLVFAPNAGLPAFPSWLPTLRRLLAGGGGRGSDSGEARGAVGGGVAGGDRSAVGGDNSCAHRGGGGAAGWVPFLATDYCEEAAHQSLRLLASLGAPPRGAAWVRGSASPFRRPDAAVGHGAALPAFGNAAVFGWA